MAMATASTSKTYQPLKRQSARSAVAVRGRSQQVEQPMVATEQTRSSSSSRYAILELGGVRQMVEEGQQYACLSRYLQDAKQSSASNNAVFHSVLGLRSDGVFQWGKPFVPDAAVEVEVLEEFQGPIPHSTNSVLVDTVMARYRVKHIRSSYATEQLSQQR